MVALVRVSDSFGATRYILVARRLNYGVIAGRFNGCIVLVLQDLLKYGGPIREVATEGNRRQLIDILWQRDGSISTELELSHEPCNWIIVVRIPMNRPPLL